MPALVAFPRNYELVVLFVLSLPDKVDRLKAVMSLRVACRHFRYLHVHFSPDSLFTARSISVPTLLRGVFTGAVRVQTIVAQFCQFWQGDGQRCPLELKIRIQGKIAASKSQGARARRSEWTPLLTEAFWLKLAAALIQRGFRVGVQLCTTSFRVTAGVPSAITVVNRIPTGVSSIWQQGSHELQTCMAIAPTEGTGPTTPVYGNLKRLAGPFGSGSHDMVQAMFHACPGIRRIDFANSAIRVPQPTNSALFFDDVKLKADDVFYVEAHASGGVLRSKKVTLVSGHYTQLKRCGQTPADLAAEEPVIECDHLVLRNLFSVQADTVPADSRARPVIVATRVDVEGTGGGKSLLSMRWIASLPDVLSMRAVTTLTMANLFGLSWTAFSTMTFHMPHLKVLIVYRCCASQGGIAVGQLRELPLSVRTFEFVAEKRQELLFDVFSLSSAVVHSNIETLAIQLGSEAARYVRMHSMPSRYVTWMANLVNVQALKLRGINVRVLHNAMPGNLQRFELDDASLAMASGSAPQFSGVAVRLRNHVCVEAVAANLTMTQANTFECDIGAVAAVCAVAAVLPSLVSLKAIENVLLPSTPSTFMPYVDLLRGARGGMVDQRDVNMVHPGFVQEVMKRTPYAFHNCTMRDQQTGKQHQALRMLNVDFTATPLPPMFGRQANGIFVRGRTSGDAIQPFDPSIPDEPITSVLAPVAWLPTGSDNRALAALAIPETLQRIATGPDAVAMQQAQDCGVVVVYAGVHSKHFDRPGLITGTTLVVAAAHLEAASGVLNLGKAPLRHVQVAHVAEDAPPDVIIAAYALQLVTIANKGLN